MVYRVHLHSSFQPPVPPSRSEPTTSLNDVPEHQPQGGASLEAAVHPVECARLYMIPVLATEDGGGSRVCGACGEEGAYQCRECAEDKRVLCEACRRAHDRWVEHTVDNIEDAAPYTGPVYCQQHQLRVQFYCQDDRILACAQCFLEQHNGHVCTTVDTAAKEASQQRAQLRKRLDKLTQTMTRHQEACMHQQVQLDDKATSVSHAINSAFQSLHETLDTRQKELQTTLEETLQHHRATLLEMHATLETLMSSCFTGSTLLDHDDALPDRALRLFLDTEAFVNDAACLHFPLHPLSIRFESNIDSLVSDCRAFGAVFETGHVLHFHSSGTAIDLVQNGTTAAHHDLDFSIALAVTDPLPFGRSVCTLTIDTCGFVGVGVVVDGPDKLDLNAECSNNLGTSLVYGSGACVVDGQTAQDQPGFAVGDSITLYLTKTHMDYTLSVYSNQDKCLLQTQVETTHPIRFVAQLGRHSSVACRSEN